MSFLTNIRHDWEVLSRAGLLLLVLSLLAGCASAPAQAGTPLKVEWTQWGGDYTLIMAKEKGFFDKDAVSVEPVYYGTFSKALPDLSVGNLDGALFGMSDVLTVGSTEDIKAVLVYDDGGESSVVAVPQVQSIADLKGKRIGVGVGSTRELIVQEMLKSASLTTDDVTLVSVDPEQVPDRLGKDIDAGYTWEPYTSQAEEKGNHILSSTSEYPLNPLPDLLVFRSAITQSRPNDVRAFIKAWFEAVDYREKNAAECNAIVAKALGSAVEKVSGDPKLLTLADNQQFFADITGTDSKSIYYITYLNLDFLVKNNGVTTPPDVKVLLDPSFWK